MDDRVELEIGHRLQHGDPECLASLQDREVRRVRRGVSEFADQGPRAPRIHFAREADLAQSAHGHVRVLRERGDRDRVHDVGAQCAELRDRALEEDAHLLVFRDER
jgi:hypothetical protein